MEYHFGILRISVTLPWICIYLFIKLASATLEINDTLEHEHQRQHAEENTTSVERSVSVSFDNTKIYFFGDKIEFAGEVHNRYPDASAPGGIPVGVDGGLNGVGETETDENGHVLRRWGAPVPPGLRPWKPIPRVHYVDAECQNDYMKITILFNGSFNGMIYSSRYAYNPDCLYINGTGAQRYEFYIRLNRCGTLGGGPKGRQTEDDDKKMMWNTLTVQYNPLIEEEWDQHFRVTCEYGYQYWKKVSFPVVDVRVPTESPLLFTLSPPECQMEIRMGFNLNGLRVAGPVNVGDPLTLVIYMRSPTVGFDIIINNCYAHNGANKRMALIDEHGCPVENKIISDFKGVDIHHGVYESKVYAYFKAFRFTGSPALYIECDVRMCHGICPKQRCYWRNLRGRTDTDGAKNESNKNETSTNETSSSGNDTTSNFDIADPNIPDNIHLFSVPLVPKSDVPFVRNATFISTATLSTANATNQTWIKASTPRYLRGTKPTSSTLKSPTTTKPSTTTTTAATTTTSTTTTSTSTARPSTTTVTGTPTKQRVTLATTTKRPYSMTTTRQTNRATPTVAKPSMTVSPTIYLRKTTVGLRPKSDATSVVNLNINSRRTKRSASQEGEDDVNNTISNTVNLFQALEVRSDVSEEVSRFNGADKNLVCIKTIGFTAIISLLVLLLILVTSVSCMLCARLRRLQRPDSDFATLGKCYANHNYMAAIKVHRTS